LFSLALTDAFAGEFERKTDVFLLGMPIEPGKIYWTKYIFNLSIYLLPAAIEFVMLGLLVGFEKLTFALQLQFGLSYWCVAAGIVALLLIHAVVFFCTMAGRNSSNGVAGLLLLPVLFILTLPGIPLILIFVEKVEWFAFLIYLVIDGLLLYSALLFFGYYIWTRRLARGLFVTKPLVIAGLLLPVLALLVFGATYVFATLELQLAMRNARNAGLILERSRLITPLTSQEQDAFPLLSEFDKEYALVKQKAKMNNVDTQSFIANLEKPPPSCHLLTAAEIKTISKTLVNDPDFIYLNLILAKISGMENPRIKSPTTMRQRDYYWGWRGIINSAVDFLIERGYALRLSRRTPEMLSGYRTALRLSSLLAKEQFRMVGISMQRLNFTIAQAMIETADFTPESVSLFREMTVALDGADTTRGMEDSSDLPEWWNNNRDEFIDGCMLRKNYIFPEFKDSQDISLTQEILRLLALPRAQHLLASRLNPRFYQLEVKIRQCSLFKEIKTEHDVFFKQHFAEDRTLTPDYGSTPVTWHYLFRTKASGYKLALALLIYRTEHGAFPDKLDVLAPAILPTIPVSSFNGKAFDYRRDGKGFILTNDDGPSGSEANNGFSLKYQPWDGRLEAGK